MAVKQKKYICTTVTTQYKKEIAVNTNLAQFNKNVSKKYILLQSVKSIHPYSDWECSKDELLDKDLASKLSLTKYYNHCHSYCWASRKDSLH